MPVVLTSVSYSEGNIQRDIGTALAVAKKAARYLLHGRGAVESAELSKRLAGWF